MHLTGPQGCGTPGGYGPFEVSQGRAANPFRSSLTVKVFRVPHGSALLTTGGSAPQIRPGRPDREHRGKHPTRYAPLATSLRAHSPAEAGSVQASGAHSLCSAQAGGPPLRLWRAFWMTGWAGSGTRNVGPLARTPLVANQFH
jgi:hypothetical protein